MVSAETACHGIDLEFVARRKLEPYAAVKVHWVRWKAVSGVPSSIRIVTASRVPSSVRVVTASRDPIMAFS